jgi:hypothetical protein
MAVTMRRLTDAVSALADPTPACIGGGAYRWSESLYTRLLQALQGGTLPARRACMRNSRLPCRVDALTLLIEIDTTVGGWEPHGKTTVERLHEVAARGWRPLRRAQPGPGSSKTSNGKPSRGLDRPRSFRNDLQKRRI